MISHDALLAHARELLTQGTANANPLMFQEMDEVRVRRAVSAAYYALFHALADEGATQVASPRRTELQAHSRRVSELQVRVRRAFDHIEMKEVCSIFAKWNQGRARDALEAMLGGSPDPRLRNIAAAFVELQEARHQADYDLVSLFWPQGVRLVTLAMKAHEIWLEIRGEPQAVVFLTALLLGKRLYRHG